MSDQTSEVLPFHAQNPLDRFSNRADDYARYRPSYPATAIDAILAGLGEPTGLTVADVGAGTGISSRLIADRGATVWAIEPNATMRDAAKFHPQVKFCNSTAEQTGLPDSCVNLVLCCQSFHWFQPENALAEFHRILQPQGRVALMWNERNREDALTKQYTDAIRQAIDPQCFEHFDRKVSQALELQQSPLFENYSSQVFTHSHPLDRLGLVGIALSASYVPKSGAAYEQLMVDLQQLYEQWAQNAGEEPGKETVHLSYRTHLYLANAR